MKAVLPPFSAFTSLSFLRRTGSLAVVLLLASAIVCGSAAGQELVYTPKNPAFGGSPYNYQWMLSSAQTQNRFKDDDFGSFERDPLQDFQQGLQRQILSQLSRELIQNRFGDSLDLTQEGRYDLGDFVIEVIPGVDGVNIRVFNVLTGDESIITIPSL